MTKVHKEETLCYVGLALIIAGAAWLHPGLALIAIGAGIILAVIAD